ncbi:hypothetical protein F443_02289 [Phytophthora nicotianae P1569]|uniref:Uncharacterized protein n=1 Tax=Phytophthora nicotianae P1569 TaxID=1317065 RepID=V9FV94_PHYNI|nr:hypothetical protein F443_02289 [Phytophthora nicotianae P1569]
MSEKAAIKFKPNLSTSEIVCVSFPAVNAAGEVTGGLKATNDNSACKYAIKGSQGYERSGWYKDLWAITLGGELQDLIMWEQLTDVARMALNDSTNFENAEVPISDDHYEDHLDKARPL